MSSTSSTASRLLVGVLVLGGVAIAVPAALQAAAASPSMAQFENSVIDLRQGWGDAHACATNGVDTTVCFRTQADMDAYLATHPGLGSRRRVTPFVNCATSLRLYDGTSFTGNTLALSGRGLWLNMSTYGFDNVTSSYQVGACNSTFNNLANGSGLTYPGNTNANASSSTMSSGWDNTVSSVFIS